MLHAYTLAFVETLFAVCFYLDTLDVEEVFMSLMPFLVTGF